MRSLVVLFILLLSCPSIGQDSIDATHQPPSSSSVITINDASQSASEPVTAEQLLQKLNYALHNLNFDASFIVIFNKKGEPYRWLHGIHQGVELEHLSLLNGAGQDIVRRDKVVTYFDPQQPPYSINSGVIRGPIPEILFTDISNLKQHYSFVLAGKKRIAGREAQLIRIIANDKHLYNFKLWLDVRSGMLLKAAYVNDSGEELEQIQLTHITVTEQPHPELIKLSAATLPEVITPPVSATSQQASTSLDVDVVKNSEIKINNWRFGWLPSGFKVIKSDKHQLSLTREASDYYMFSDGLIDFSVFIQRPLSGSSNSVLTKGAITLYNHRNQVYDVSVVGRIPAKTAQLIAQSVSHK
ncbi:MucB/RseB C-terminal domain-containing protein [Flocculibacter collagenilyticus]|uniref:MucB/RseB C-terminal domain-containing protein n=1 Tax=Flocculibacter collagenilyticus TaxID=2744479 RepID=UPI0018F79AEE|nr:MucB/RseB C-terminal domain-containing protein [Flocculibacter collagenilyticus]